MNIHSPTSSPLVGHSITTVTITVAIHARPMSIAPRRSLLEPLAPLLGSLAAPERTGDVCQVSIPTGSQLLPKTPYPELRIISQCCESVHSTAANFMFPSIKLRAHEFMCQYCCGATLAPPHEAIGSTSGELDFPLMQWQCRVVRCSENCHGNAPHALQDYSATFKS